MKSRKIETVTSWNQITVRQFQLLCAVQISDPAEEFDKDDQLLKIIYNLSDEEISNLPFNDYKTLLSSIYLLLDTEMPTLVKRTISVNGKRYGIELNVENISVASRMAILKYMPTKNEDIIENLHYLFARLVFPMRRNIVGKWVKKKHQLKHFDTYCEDVAQAPITDVLSVFKYYKELLLGVAKEYVQVNESLLIDKANEVGMSKDAMSRALQTYYELSDKLN